MRNRENKRNINTQLKLSNITFKENCENIVRNFDDTYIIPLNATNPKCQFSKKKQTPPKF